MIKSTIYVLIYAQTLGNVFPNQLHSIVMVTNDVNGVWSIYPRVYGTSRDCLEYIDFVLAVIPLKCGFIIVQVRLFDSFNDNYLVLDWRDHLLVYGRCYFQKGLRQPV